MNINKSQTIEVCKIAWKAGEKNFRYIFKKI